MLMSSWIKQIKFGGERFDSVSMRRYLDDGVIKVARVVVNSLKHAHFT